MRWSAFGITASKLGIKPSAQNNTRQENMLTPNIKLSAQVKMYGKTKFNIQTKQKKKKKNNI
jgi:hypothetical protein